MCGHFDSKVFLATYLRNPYELIYLLAHYLVRNAHVRSRCWMKAAISPLPIVPDLSVSKAAKTSSKARCENWTAVRKCPRVSTTNFAVASLPSAPVFSRSYMSQYSSMTL